MKKFLNIALGLTISFALSACGGNSGSDDSNFSVLLKSIEILDLNNNRFDIDITIVEQDSEVSMK